jgi:type I restriction enzyme M protein
MLPLTVLRRLDCVLEPTKQKVLSEYQVWKDKGKGILEAKLIKVTGVPFYNISNFTFDKLRGDPTNIAPNLGNFMKGFSDKARNILDSFGFEEHIEKLEKADRLFLVVSKFAEVDLHPQVVPNIQMGYIFEELIRKFNEASNEEAGDHFTPREVIRLMVDLLLTPDKDILTKKGIVKTICDPAAGTGGMLSITEEYLRELNPDAQLEVFGQDYNPQSYAICGSDLLIKGQNIDHIVFGDSFTADGFKGMTFHYLLANPPFGVKWEAEQNVIEKEAEELGYGGRFGAGLPRINDGSFLFLQHMISKMKKPKDGGTRLVIVFNGSPLFTGGAGSGESEIRKWIIESDWLEAIVALPDQLFYNTGISTYLWIVTNRKEEKRKWKVQLIDGTSFFNKMRKSLGNKRNEIDDEHREEIVQLYGSFKEGKNVKIFKNSDFGYQRITVERPLKLNFTINDERLERLRQTSQFQSLSESKKRKDTASKTKEEQEGRKLQEKIIAALKNSGDTRLYKNQGEFENVLKKLLKSNSLNLKAPLYKAILGSLSERDETADTVVDSKGNQLPDPELRDFENVPLGEKIEEYVRREVLPYVPDAWIDEAKTKTGYEISFNRYFYVYQPPRSVEEIEKDLEQIEGEIASLLKEKNR